MVLYALPVLTLRLQLYFQDNHAVYLLYYYHAFAIRMINEKEKKM